MGGISIFGGFNISSKGLLIIAAVATITAFTGYHWFSHRKPVMSYAVKSYASDTNPSIANHKILTLILRGAVNKDQVRANYDILLGTVRQYQQNIKNLVDERRSGEISSEEFHAKLMEIVKDIAAKVGIQLGDLRLKGIGPNYGKRLGHFKRMAKFKRERKG